MTESRAMDERLSPPRSQKSVSVREVKSFSFQPPSLPPEQIVVGAQRWTKSVRIFPWWGG